ncbi:polysaccharide deacetylase family protein [Mesorhizobium tianshanense]|uniref:polysaccharide deacetylase family protein n=1 Tax=Mesorhizobium tianshanense TaxID=39844 RepID=UPI003898DC7A
MVIEVGRRSQSTLHTEILDVLAQHGVPATFFVMGRTPQTSPNSFGLHKQLVLVSRTSLVRGNFATRRGSGIESRRKRKLEGTRWQIN